MEGCHTPGSIAAECFRAPLGLFSPNLIDQSACRILTTHTKARPILHDDWSNRLGENSPNWARKHLEAMLLPNNFSIRSNSLVDRNKVSPCLALNFVVC